MSLFKCKICCHKKLSLKSWCKECNKLFSLVQKNLGILGLGQMIDALIATGIPKDRIKKFLESDPWGQGSILDQITAQLTNNLASGIGVKGADVSAQDVAQQRKKPLHLASQKPIE